MNAVVALCHFCELHGPAVLFCTRAFAEQEHDTESSDTESRDGHDSGPSSWYCSLENASSNTTDSASAPVSPSADKPKIPALCEACRSFETGHSGFISNDLESQVSYISSQYPHQPEVYCIIRQACVRSLSGEVCTGRDCPIFFGDDQGIHILSHNFFLKDNNYSRGFQRNYSIIVVMTDKIFLLNSWPFLTKHIRHIIDHLKVKADAVYSKESLRYSLSEQKPPPASFRNQKLFRLIRSGTKSSRSLKDLTGDKHIFEWLHKAFTWLLKAGSNRLIERMLEGPPTEESAVDMEKQEETEEGFVKLFFRDDVHKECPSSAPHSDSEETDKPAAIFTHPRNLLKVLGYSRFHELVHHIVIGHQLIVRSRSRKLVHSAIDCLKAPIDGRFKSKSQSKSRTVGEAESNSSGSEKPESQATVFLPKGCCHVVYFTKSYHDWDRCNFVGMSLDVPLPEDLPPSIVLQISEPSMDRELERGCISSEMTRSMLASESQWSFSELESYHYVVYSPTSTVLPQKGPTVLEKMEKTLLCENLVDCLVEPFLTCLKEEWLNKAKVLYKYTKVGGNRLKEDAKLLNVIGAKEEDRTVLEFWMKGLSLQHQSCR